MTHFYLFWEKKVSLCDTIKLLWLIKLNSIFTPPETCHFRKKTTICWPPFQIFLYKKHCYVCYLELLGLLDPDLDLGVGAEAGPTQQGNLLLLCQQLRVLGVQHWVVHTLWTPQHTTTALATAVVATTALIKN